MLYKNPLRKQHIDDVQELGKYTTDQAFAFILS